MKQNLQSATPRVAGDAVVAGKHGAPLISDARLLDLHAALRRASRPAQKNGRSAARVRFPAVYAALLADLALHDRVTADYAINLDPFAVGAPLPVSPEIATGLAMGLAAHQSGSLVVAFTRSSSLDPARFRQTLRLAAQHRLPILYVLLPASRAPQSFDWSARAIIEDVPAIPVDAHDAVALCRVAQETIQRARTHGGPTLIECKQVHLARGDSNTVARMESHLRRRGLMSPAQRQVSESKLPSSSRLAKVLADYDQTGCR